MLKSPKNPNKRQRIVKRPKLVAVLKNSMTEAEMQESGDAWANHQGPYLTLAEVLSIEAAKLQKQQH